MMLYKRIALLCLTVWTFFLVSCQAPVYNQTVSNIADEAQRIKDNRHKANALAKPIPSLVVNQGLYVDKTPISLMKQPRWLKNRIIIRGDQLPFSYYSRVIANGGSKDILLHYQNGLNQGVKLSLNFSGTVRDALDLLAANTGYVYSVNGSNINWQAYITKTFEIGFMPGSSDYLMGKTGSGGGAGSGGSAAAGVSNTVTGTIDDSSASQYSNIKGTLSIWKDLKDSITQMLTPEGKVMVSEATTSVTVRDRPSNVALVGKFIQNMNNNLAKQVLVKIEVLQVTLENDFNFGINWNLVQNAFGNGFYQLVSNNGSPIAISSITGLTGSVTTAGINNTGVAAMSSGGAYKSGVLTLINALKQQGKLSVTTQPQVLCQNNQVSAVRIIDQVGYLASIQTTSFSGGTGSTAPGVTSQITPGAVVTGVTLYVLPKIMGNKVYLQVNADLSTNLGISTITSNGAVITPGQTPPAGTSIIQVPNVQQKQFNQRSVITSGDTLILAGFKQTRNATGAEQMFDSQALGGRTSQQTTTETVVLITPIILHGPA